MNRNVTERVADIEAGIKFNRKIGRKSAVAALQILKRDVIRAHELTGRHSDADRNRPEAIMAYGARVAQDVARFRAGR